MIFCHDSLNERDEPAAKSYTTEISARPRIEHAARRPRERPPGRAIYFCVCLRVCVDVCQCPLACPAPRHERTPNDRQRATEQLDVQPNERPREQPNEQPREQPHDQRTVSLKHLFCVSCSAYTCRAYYVYQERTMYVCGRDCCVPRCGRAYLRLILRLNGLDITH